MLTFSGEEPNGAALTVRLAGILMLVQLTTTVPPAFARKPATTRGLPEWDLAKEGFNATASAPFGSKAALTSRTSSLENKITGLQVARTFGRELTVIVGYSYAGTHGLDDVFLHAAALVGDELRSRVPGTSFPGEPVRVGSGSVTLSITRTSVLETRAVTSNTIRACLVSLRWRTAFLCRDFPQMHEWD